jgi:hypothetical protein
MLLVPQGGIAGTALGFAPRGNLRRLLDELPQVLAGKFSAEPKHQACHLAQGEVSLEKLADSLKDDLRRQSPPPSSFFLKPDPRLCPSSPERSPSSSQANQLRFSDAAAAPRREKAEMPASHKQFNKVTLGKYLRVRATEKGEESMKGQEVRFCGLIAAFLAASVLL